MESKALERVLLPSDVKPQHYTIHLTPYFESFTFSGTSSIDLTVNSSSNSITVNALHIEVVSAILTQDTHIENASEIVTDEKGETVQFKFIKGVEKGKGDAKLELKFKGLLNDKMAGFYRSSYQHDGKTKFLATTQFEPADARQAFPCFDEPSLKATYTIIITAPKDMEVLSNMPPKSVSLGEELKTVEFEKTPIISSYLIAFCVGHFEHIESKTKTGITFRVWTTPGKKEMGQFALDVGVKVLSYFEEYYGIPYPLPKQDMIAVPDFLWGAMENWGLITYRETALLCDTTTASVAAKARVAYVVAHELAHQWFGNLVTMEWWKELWLNEGFATFVGTQAIDNFFPEWKVWSQFVTDYIMRALSADSLRSSHPVEVDVAEARAIEEIFDAISYCKGASVIRMIENYLGKEAFRKGLNLYLNKFKYSNAKTQDLWEHLSAGSGKDVAKIMDAWIKKIGYPVLSVEETETPGKLKVRQRRFLSGGELKSEEDSTVWTLTVGVSTQSHPEVKFIEVSTKDGEITVDTQNPYDWIKINAGQSGFFRVQYSKTLSSNLGKAINALQLSPVDRLGIQNDAFALARSGDIPLSQALEIALNFENETEYPTWADLSSNLSGVSSLFQGTEAAPLFDKYILKLFSKIRNLGWDPVEGESDLNKLLRAVVLSNLGDHGDQSVVEEAKKRFEAYLSDKNSIPNDIAGVVFKLAVRNGGEKEYFDMINIFKSATQPEAIVRACRCIGLVKNVDLIKKALEYSLSDSVRGQDFFYPLAACASTPQGMEVTWEFLKDNWEKIQAKSPGLLGRIISSTVDSFSTEEKEKEMVEFFKTHTNPSIERSIQQSIESVRSNIKFHARNLNDTTAWLKAHFNQ